LPKIPDSFLYLMGISSAGYIGGKLARKPGPVMRLLAVDRVTQPLAGPPPVPATMAIGLRGENLASNASVKIDDQTLRPDQYSIKVVKSQDQPADPLFCSEVELTLKEATKYLEGEHPLTLTNADGQSASARFPLDPLAIDLIPDLPRNTAPVDVPITGKNFGERTSAEWKDASGKTSSIPEAQVKKVSDVRLMVTLTPGTTVGEGALTLISQIGLRASRKVNVT
jgi:hypothetical protein